MERIEKSLRNVKTAWIMQAVHIICQFAIRTVIIKVLSIEYAGLSGLFSNILNMLSMAELGIGEAIIFSLYEPIAKGNKETIKSIMSLYQKVYIGIGIFILLAGSLITPYLSFFVKDLPDDIPNIGWIYILYVVNSAISYFFSYKAAFVTANQENYLVVMTEGLAEIIMVACQIVALVLTHNFLLFLAVSIFFVLVRNIIITLIADKKFPYLKEKTKKPIPGRITKNIKKNTGAMVIHKLGAVVVFATDNIIISKFVGLVSTGIYGNYCVITNSLNLFLRKFFSAITASVGNLAATSNAKAQQKSFERLYFINFVLFSVSSCALFSLLNSFIRLIWGDYIFDQLTVLTIVISFYITGMRCSVQTFKGAKGLYWQNKLMPIAESAINLITSILLVKWIGVVGVVLGTIISSLSTCVWIEPRVLYRDGFGLPLRKFFSQYLKYFSVFLIMLFLTFIFTFNYQVFEVSIISLIKFCFSLMFSIIIPCLIIITIYHNNPCYNYCKQLFKDVIYGKYNKH